MEVSKEDADLLRSMLSEGFLDDAKDLVQDKWTECILSRIIDRAAPPVLPDYPSEWHDAAWFQQRQAALGTQNSNWWEQLFMREATAAARALQQQMAPPPPPPLLLEAAPNKELTVSTAAASESVSEEKSLSRRAVLVAALVGDDDMQISQDVDEAVLRLAGTGGDWCAAHAPGPDIQSLNIFRHFF